MNLVAILLIRAPLPGLQTPMKLLGRADECALLDKLVDDLSRGESRSMVLRGEAGVGKTALLQYLDRVRCGH